jgi:hypothetical protein
MAIYIYNYPLATEQARVSRIYNNPDVDQAKVRMDSCHDKGRIVSALYHGMGLHEFGGHVARLNELSPGAWREN